MDDIPEKIRNRFLARLTHLAQQKQGPLCLPDLVNHQLEGKIFQLSGDFPYRFPYFYDENQCVLISHSFAKRGGKKNTTPKGEIKKAEEIREQYFAAKAKGTLTIVEDEQNDE